MRMRGGRVKCGLCGRLITLEAGVCSSGCRAGTEPLTPDAMAVRLAVLTLAACPLMWWTA